jgi:hypothetical protein
MAAQLARRRRGARLVHGHVERPVGPIIRHHAWVEVGRKHRRIIDPTVGIDDMDTTLRKHGIRYVAEQVYDAEEALVRLVRSGHWGPWAGST